MIDDIDEVDCEDSEDEEEADDAGGDGIAEADDADGEAEWLTGALRRAIQSFRAQDYYLFRRKQTDEWLLLRREAFVAKPVVIAEYPGDEDLYQMAQQAMAAVERDIARHTDSKGNDGDPSVYRYGL